MWHCALAILHESARQTHDFGGLGRCHDARAHDISKLGTQHERQHKTAARPARDGYSSTFSHDDAGRDALEQSDQLRQLGSQLLQVLVAPLEPIVSSSFKKVVEEGAQHLGGSPGCGRPRPAEGGSARAACRAE